MCSGYIKTAAGPAGAVPGEDREREREGGESFVCQYFVSAKQVRKMPRKNKLGRTF